MTYTLSQITKQINLSSPEYDIDIDIDGIHTLIEATPTQLSFFNSEKYKDQLPQTKAAAVLIEEKYADLLPESTIALITDEPYLKLAVASKLFAHNLESKGGHPAMGEGCDIDKRVRFGKNVNLGRQCNYLGGLLLRR